jgi:hypothetical protein
MPVSLGACCVESVIEITRSGGPGAFDELDTQTVPGLQHCAPNPRLREF